MKKPATADDLINDLDTARLTLLPSIDYFQIDFRLACKVINTILALKYFLFIFSVLATNANVTYKNKYINTLMEHIL